MGEMTKFTVNNQRFWSGLLTKKDGKEISPAPFFIYPLSEKHSQAMAFLSKKIYKHLKEEEQCFIHKHSASYYDEVFKKQDIIFVGVFHESKLIGMSYLKVCSNSKTFQDEIPSYPYQSFSNGQKVATLGGDCVHPQFRGNGLNQLMIEYRIELAKQLKCDAIYSIIDRNNHWNMPPYFNNRFQMLSSGIDPSDGGQIAVMCYKDQQPQRIGKEILIPSHHFGTIDKLLQNDFVGCVYHPKTKQIAFRRTALPLHIRSHQQIKQIRRLRQQLKENQNV